MSERQPGPLPAGHPDLGRPCFFCDIPVSEGDVVTFGPAGPDTVVAHLACERTAEDVMDIAAARAALAEGDFVPYEQVRRELGLDEHVVRLESEGEVAP